MEPLNIVFAAAAGVGGLTALTTGAVLLKSSFFSVEQKTEALITKFGKYIRTEKEPGLHFKLPAPFNRIEARIPTSLQQITNTLEIKTSDDLFVGLPITVQWEIANSKKYYFDSNKPVEQVMSLIDQSLRAHLSGKSFQDLYSSDRATLSNTVINDIASHATDDYGISVKRVIIDQPKPSAEVKAKYESVRTSAMGAQAAENEGKTTIIRETSKAEGEKQRDFLRGDGAAGYRQRIFAQYAEQIKGLEEKGIAPEVAGDMMMRMMTLDTYREIAEKGNLVIVVPDSEDGKSVGTVQAALRASGIPAPLPLPTGPTLQ